MTDSETYSALSFNPDDYRQFLKGAGMTEAQEREFLEALWNIVVGFVDMGFSQKPVEETTDSKL